MSYNLRNHEASLRRKNMVSLHLRALIERGKRLISEQRHRSGRTATK